MAEKKVKLGALGIEETKIGVRLKGLAKIPKNFTSEGVGKTSNKPFKSLNIGIETEKNNVVYCEIYADQRDLYFYSKAEGKSEKVSFANRLTFKKEGYEVIGKKIGIGDKTSNQADWETIDFIKNNIKDGDPIFILADITFSQYETTTGEMKLQKKIEIKSLYSSSEKIDFVTVFGENSFNANMIYQDIVQNKEEKDVTKFDVSAKYVAYKDILDVEYVVRDTNLAKAIKTGIKPYSAIVISGKVVNKAETVEVKESSNAWGDFTDNSVVTNYTTELLILGANPNSIDKEKYSEKNIEEALARKVIIDLEKKPKALPIKDAGTYVQNEFGEFTPNPAGVADDTDFVF